MYGKIFTAIYDGTLREDWRALVTFQQLLVLADADDEVDMTVEALVARTGIPREILEPGIEALEQPDPNSRSKVHDGARIVRLDPERNWGWLIVNRAAYKNIRDQSDRREYHREYRRARREERNQAQPGATTVNTRQPQAVGSRKEKRGRDVDSDSSGRSSRARGRRAPGAAAALGREARPSRLVPKGDAEEARQACAEFRQLNADELAGITDKKK